MLERLIENYLYTSRWILAPIFLGLSLAMVLLGLKFYQELFHTLPMVFAMREDQLVLSVLALVDLALVASLVVMVMFSGYENFVSRLNIDEAQEKLSWLGKLDSGSLKLKVAASIVAISAIHLLRVFMNAEDISNDKLLWYVLIHLTFVVSALMMAWIDRITRQ